MGATIYTPQAIRWVFASSSIHGIEWGFPLQDTCLTYALPSPENEGALAAFAGPLGNSEAIRLIAR